MTEPSRDEKVDRTMAWLSDPDSLDWEFLEDNQALEHRQFTERMVERGARALYERWLRTTSFFRDFEELRETFEEDARLVLRAALADHGAPPNKQAERTDR